MVQAASGMSRKGLCFSDLGTKLWASHERHLCLAEEDSAGLWAVKILGQHIIVALVAPSGYFDNH
jgi:hypothetical protein